MRPTRPETQKRAVRPRHPAGRLPFTLLELVVATLILTLLLGTLVAAAHAVTRSWEKIRAEQERFALTLTLDRTFDAILPGIIPFEWPNTDGDIQQVFEGEPDRVHFAYLHPVASVNTGGIRFLSLAVERGNLIAVYSERPSFLYDDLGQTASLSVLSENVEFLELRYADWRDPEEGLAWLDRWPESEDLPRSEVPLAIWLRIVWQDGREETWLRRTLGNGVFERLGQWRPRGRGGVTPPGGAG
jgi:hypothetical protein